MNRRFIYITFPWVFLLLAGCTDGRVPDAGSGVQVVSVKQEIQRAKPLKLAGDIPIPAGYQRVEGEPGSFTEYLRNLPLDTISNRVYLFNGQLKFNQSVQYTVLDMDVGNRDLQQCADAVMRLQAEYLFGQGREDEISFQFTSGDDVPFSKYAEGWRPSVNGNTVQWFRIEQESHSYKTFRSYMDLIFSYAGSYSLSRQLIPVRDLSEIMPGDVFIRGGFPGHAVIVMDVAVKDNGNAKLFMLAQSYMPAQDIHILINPADPDHGPWYWVSDDPLISTPEWTFVREELMRFPGF